jgi:hypothetical protein
MKNALTVLLMCAALAAAASSDGRYEARAYGAAGAAETDDTAAIQTAIQAAERDGGGRVTIAPGRYVISAPLVVTGRVWIEGAGPDLTFIVNRGEQGAVVFDFRGLGGALTRGAGIRGLSVVAGSVESLAKDGSAGTGIEVIEANHQFRISDVVVKNHATGIALENCWYAHVDSATVWAARTAGIRVKGGGSNKVTNSTMSNQSTSGAEDDRSAGLAYLSGGGLDVANVHALEFGYGLVIAPAAGEAALYGSFTQFSSDTNRLGGCMVDGSAAGAKVYSMRFTNSWCAYNGFEAGRFAHGAAGLHVKGAGVDTVIFTGGALRENGGHGALIEGGTNVILSNNEVTANGNAQSMRYAGISIGDWVVGVQVQGNRVGRFATMQTAQTACGISVGTGAEHLMILGNDLRGNAAAFCGSSVPSATRRIGDNLPLGL